MTSAEDPNTWIELSLVHPEGKPISICIEDDADSSMDPTHWVWMMFNDEDENWFKMTYEEAARIRDRLIEVVGQPKHLVPAPYAHYERDDCCDKTRALP